LYKTDNLAEYGCKNIRQYCAMNLPPQRRYPNWDGLPLNAMYNDGV